jgi:hypothetical protein
MTTTRSGTFRPAVVAQTQEPAIDDPGAMNDEVEVRH